MEEAYRTELVIGYTDADSWSKAQQDQKMIKNASSAKETSHVYSLSQKRLPKDYNLAHRYQQY